MACVNRLKGSGWHRPGVPVFPSGPVVRVRVSVVRPRIDVGHRQLCPLGRALEGGLFARGWTSSEIIADTGRWGQRDRLIGGSAVHGSDVLHRGAERGAGCGSVGCLHCASFGEPVVADIGKKLGAGQVGHAGKNGNDRVIGVLAELRSGGLFEAVGVGAAG